MPSVISFGHLVGEKPLHEKLSPWTILGSASVTGLSAAGLYYWSMQPDLFGFNLLGTVLAFIASSCLVWSLLTLVRIFHAQCAQAVIAERQVQSIGRAVLLNARAWVAIFVFSVGFLAIAKLVDVSR